MDAVKEIEKFSKYLYLRVCHVIVQSRQGSKIVTQSTPKPNKHSWFCLEITENSEINHNAKKAFGYSQGASIWNQPLCVEMSLKTTEGESLVLENWLLSVREDFDSSMMSVNTIYTRMGILLRSLLCVTRALPAYKLSRRQGPDTFVMCYKIFSGEHSNSQLGNGFQTCRVGEIETQLGKICLSVDYRTQMTISPPTSAFGLDSYSGQPIMLKSDHFSDCESYTPRPNSNLRPSNLHTNSEGSDHAVTSDESQEAMRIFATSPPEGMQYQPQYTSPSIQRQTRRLHSADHHSSNESLGRKIQFRPRSGTNQSIASDDTDSENYKLGAFATKRDILPRKVPTGICNENREDEESALMDLFTVEESGLDVHDEKSTPRSPAVGSLENKLRHLDIHNPKSKIPLGSSTARKISFDENPATETKPSMKGDEFVLLDIRTPFSTSGKPGNFGDMAQSSLGSAADLGIFFKDPPISAGLKSSPSRAQQSNLTDEDIDFSIGCQLQHIDEEINSFEMQLTDYDNMIKHMESNSESEIE